MLHRTSRPDYRYRVSSHAGRAMSLLVASVVLGALIVVGGGVAGPLMPSAYPVAPSRCPEAKHPFPPRSVTIPGVDKHTTVLALRRDSRGVPRTPPISDRGKWQFAWDKPSGIGPGSERGNVKFNAHTYPDGSALGNRLLGQLHVGQRIIVFGPKGQRFCYEVTKRIEVSGDRPYHPYFSTRGKPQLAILVCSGVRRGPGDWAKRTIWYASPVIR